MPIESFGKTLDLIGEGVSGKDASPKNNTLMPVIITDCPTIHLSVYEGKRTQ